MIAEMHGREQDALSDFESSNILTDFDNFARHIAAEDMGQLHAGQTFPHPYIEVIHSAGFYANENLILARLRIRHVFVAEHLRTAEFVDADSFHGDSAQKSKLPQDDQSPIIPNLAKENLFCVTHVTKKIGC
jgi:hypothetical protein